MKYMVGLSSTRPDLADCIIKYRSQISEVYFSWGDFANGRSSQLERTGYTPWELQKQQIEALSRLSEAGLEFNLLFNANCYGNDSQSRAFLCGIMCLKSSTAGAGNEWKRSIWQFRNKTGID